MIGDATYRRLAAGATAQRLAPFEARGKREPVEAYVLIELGGLHT